MADQTGQPPAGWYDDPSTPGQQRWWDGSQWTAHLQPRYEAPPPPPAPSASPPPPSGPNHGQPQYLTGAPATPMSPLGSEPGRSGMPGWAKVLLGLVAAVVLLGGCGAIISLAGDSEPDEVATGDDAADSTVTSEATTGAPDGEDEGGGQADVDEDPGTPSDGGAGTRDAPLPYGQPAELTWNVFGDADGSVWSTTVGAPRDITDEVLAANQFNDPPPEGIRFVGFDVEQTLLESSKEPLAPSFNYSWEIIGGSTARAYDQSTVETEFFGCGVVDGEFDVFAEAFMGGTLTGTVCIPLPAEDLDHPDTRVAIHFIDDSRAFFGGS